MLDTGLLISGAVAVAAMWLAARAFELPWPPNEALDRLLLPGMVGLLAGRAVALLLDDPTSLQSLRAFLVIRGGVELWPGLIVALVVLLVAARRRRETVLVTASRVAPVAMIGYAAYEATCLVREGCYGPHTAIGLRPDGIPSTMLPVGLVVAAALVGTAVVLARRLDDPPTLTLAAAAFAVAGSRSVAGVWLPRLGDALTRPHRESIAVTVLSGAALLAHQLRHRSAL